MLGVVYDNEVDANAVPLVEAAYQSIVSKLLGVAEIATTPVEHLDAFVPVGADGTTFTVAVTAVLVADVQPVATIESIA